LIRVHWNTRTNGNGYSGWGEMKREKRGKLPEETEEKVERMKEVYGLCVLGKVGKVFDSRLDVFSL